MACRLRPNFLNEGAYIKAEDRWEIEGEVFVDSSSELPGVDYFPGKRLVQGSTALDDSTWDIYVLNGSGQWNKLT